MCLPMDDTGLFSMLSLSLRLLFRGVSCFPGFPTDTLFLRQNPCFLCQYPVIPRFLREIPRMLQIHSKNDILLLVWFGDIKLSFLYTYWCRVCIVRVVGFPFKWNQVMARNYLSETLRFDELPVVTILTIMMSITSFLSELSSFSTS